ncbi:MAG: glycosyltransferase family 2 protein [Planktotalea sp.]|uniref:glycosyltransferase family 2 protein n=1 Tax=Planktotalea sp. TaxID=2029877 RepID=UPI003C79595A
MSVSSKTALVACMRNEGPFIVEWVAYHRVIGFDRIVICSNDCTDGSDALLDALDRANVITHLPHDIPDGDTPQDSGIRTAFATLEQSDIEWIAHIDADEFLNIGHGAGKVTDLLAVAGMGDVIALPWWGFGDSGHIHWPGDILSKFTMAEPAPSEARAKFKSMFRFRKFTHANDHMPTGPKVSVPDVRSANGEQLSDEGLYDKKRAKYRPLELALCPEASCINHYAVPSRDAFLMKNDRGDGQGKVTDKYYLGSRWHEIANQNGAPNLSIQRHLSATQSEIARLRAIPEIADAEAACQVWFAERCKTLLTDAQIAKWSKPHIRSARA